MKKLLHPKVVILVSLLVISLTGIMQVVLADPTRIAIITYPGEPSRDISKGDTVTIGYSKLTEADNKIEISDYPPSGIDFKFKVLKDDVPIKQINEIQSGTTPAPDAYYIVKEGKIELYIKQLLESRGEGVYTIEARQDNSTDIDFKIEIDKKSPEVHVYLDETEIKGQEDIKEIYDEDSKLVIKVKDNNFNPDAQSSYTIQGKSEGLNWDNQGTEEWKLTYELEEKNDQSLDIKICDETQNCTSVNYTKTFNVDKTEPKIEVTSSYKEVEDLKITNDNDLKILITDVNLSNAEISIDTDTYLIDANASTCQPSSKCTVVKNENNFEVTISDLKEEEYSIEIKASDNTGPKHDNHLPIKWEVDTTNPEIEPIKFNDDIPKGSYEDPINVEITVNDKNFDKNNVKINPSSLQSQVNESCWEEKEEDKNTCTFIIEEDDNYNFSVEVFDLAGNKNPSNQSRPYSFILDTVAPKIEISDSDDKNPDGKFYQTADIEVKIEEDNYQSGTFVLKKENEPNPIASGYITNQILKLEFIDEDDVPSGNQHLYFTDEGNYTLIVTAEDLDQTAAEEINFTIDRTKPVVSMDRLNEEKIEHNGINYYVYNKENQEEIQEEIQTITFYIEEAYINEEYLNKTNKPKIDLTYQSTIDAETKEKIENLNWTKTDETNKYKATIELEDGYYEFNGIEVTDKAGNSQDLAPTVQLEKFVIDTVKPIINVSDVVDEFYYKKGDEVTINVSIKETNPKESKYIIYRKESLNAQETLYKSGKITSQTDFKLPTLTENGEYRVVLTTEDMSGKKVENDTVLHFYIDHNDPKVSIKPVTQNITNGSQINVSQVTLSLSATDDWKLANTTYTVKRNNEVINIPKQGEWEDFKLSFKDEGYYQVEIETSDEAGTKTVKETLEFTIDRTSPAQLSIVGNANHHNSPTSVTDGESYSTDSVNLQFTAQDEYSFNNITLDVTKNSVVYDSKTFDVKDLRKDFTTQLSKSKDYKLSQEGEYEVTFTVYDQAGNQSNQKLSFEIDRTSPVIDSNIEDGKYYNNDFLPEFSLDQPKRDEFTFINIDDVNYNGRIPVLVSDKVYTITALATDKAQNTTDYEATFTIDKTLPTIEINNLIAGFFKDTLSPSIFYSDKNLDSSKVSIKLNDVELGMGTRDGNGYTKAFEIDKDGTYTLEVSIGDLATNVSKQTVDFILDNEQPTIDIKNKITLSNQPWIPELEVLEDYGYDIVMVTLNGEEHDITQPIDQEGKNVLFIEVMDKSGNVSSLTLQFILDLTPPKVIIEDAATHELIKDGNTYLTNLDVKVYLDYVSQEGQEDTEKITNISLNGEIVPLDNVTKENGRTVYYLSVTEFQEYELEVIAEDEAGNTTVETVMFTLEDKDIVTKIYEKKPILYSLITVTGLSILGAGVYAVMVLKKKSDHETESSEEE